jgi:hypothetical protein
MPAINDNALVGAIQQSVRSFFESFFINEERKKTAFDETNAVK